MLEAGLLLYPKDRLIIDGSPAPNTTVLSLGKDHQIQLFRGTLINLQMETGTLHFITDGETLAEALTGEGIEILEADQLSYPLETFLDGVTFDG